MLQPKFNPFFYAKFVFELNIQSSPDAGSKENTGITELEKIRIKKDLDLMLDGISYDLMTWNQKMKNENGITFDESIRVFRNEISKYVQSGMGQYMNSPEIKNAKSKDDVLSKIRSKLEEIEKHINKKLLPKFYAIQEKRIDFAKSLDSKKEEVLTYFSNYFNTTLKEDEQAKVGEEDLKNVVTALMNEFVTKNKNAIYKMTDEEIEKMNTESANKLLEKDIAEIKELVIGTIIIAWIEGKERKIYKSKNWTQNDLPDGELIPRKADTKEFYTSPLESQKGEIVIDENKLTEIKGTLDRRSALIDEFKTMGLSENYLKSDYQERISQIAKDNGWRGGYPAKWILGRWDEKDQIPANLPIMQEEVKILQEAIAAIKEAKEAGTKAGKELASKLLERVFGEEKASEIKEEAKKTQITGIKIDENGIHVEGENLQDKNGKLKIELPKAPLRIAKSNLGQPNVEFIAQGMEGIQTQLAELVKAGIVDSLVSKFTGVDFKEILSKIPNKEIEKVTKDTLKDVTPELTVRGTASPEGTLGSNLPLARKRAENVKNQILSQISDPDAKKVLSEKIKIESGVQGPDGEIIDTQEGLLKVEKALIDKWNKEVALKDEKLEDKEIDFIYKKVKNGGTTEAEKTFIENYFTNARGAGVKVDLPDDKKNIEIAMNFENKPTTTPAQPSSLGGETQVASSR